MADEHVEETSADEQSNGAEEQSNGHSNGHQIGRMAVIAAASGATAYAAKRALSSKSSPQDDEPKREKKSSSQGSGASAVNAAVSTGWDVAKDSLLPVIEDAATKAGALVAERAPEVVRDVVMPRFITGFEKARRGKRDADESDE